jgi:hypothetical protein
MIKLRFFALGIVLLSALFLTACDWSAPDGNFEYRLQGRWETSSTNKTYIGSLIITSNKITIDGYDQYDYYYNDPRRPFKDFPRKFRLDGYSEKTNDNRGIIYIENGDSFDEIPYRYDSNYNSSSHERVETLLLTFTDPGDENPLYETLIKIAE